MKLLLWLLTLFALAVGISLAAHNQGYVLLVLPPVWIHQMNIKKSAPLCARAKMKLTNGLTVILLSTLPFRRYNG